MNTVYSFGNSYFKSRAHAKFRSYRSLTDHFLPGDNCRFKDRSCRNEKMKSIKRDEKY